MGIIDYQSEYFAYELTQRCPSESVGKLAGAVAYGLGDLIPHKVGMALFAFMPPLSNEANLADDFDLGTSDDAGRSITPKREESEWLLLSYTSSDVWNERHQGRIEPITNRLDEKCCSHSEALDAIERRHEVLISNIKGKSGQKSTLPPFLIL